MHDILHPSQAGQHPDFPNAPAGWSLEQAKTAADQMGLQLVEEHWELVRVLQGCYGDEPNPPVRRLCDALAAVFKPRGGRKLLQKLCPGGPITQGCALAGLEPPSGVTLGSSGVVQ
jgi:tRNA 2-thiouridine synthesizing protein E